MTADLQRPTVKEAARIMNVSERSIYTARRIARLRPDLVPEIERGALTLNAAVAMIDGNTKPTPYAKLVKAWNAASEDDRMKLLKAAQLVPD